MAIATALILLALIALGPVQYANGKLTTEIELFDKYFSAKIDLIPIMDVVLKDNTVLKETVHGLLKSVEFRDAHIKEQREIIAGQDRMLGNMADEILELENRPPEIVEVERIVYVEIPAPLIEPEPDPPVDQWDIGGHSSSSEINNYEEPEPKEDCDREKHEGKRHGGKKGKGHRRK